MEKLSGVVWEPTYMLQTAFESVRESSQIRNENSKEWISITEWMIFWSMHFSIHILKFLQTNQDIICFYLAIFHSFRVVYAQLYKEFLNFTSGFHSRSILLGERSYSCIFCIFSLNKMNGKRNFLRLLLKIFLNNRWKGSLNSGQMKYGEIWVMGNYS